MINYNHFITWEMFLNKRLLSKIYFSNRRFVRAIFFVYILFVIICPSMASNVLIYFSQVLMLPSYRTILVYSLLTYSDFIIIFVFMSANYYFKIKYSNNNEYPLNRSTQKQCSETKTKYKSCHHVSPCGSGTVPIKSPDHASGI